jgi:DNA-binding MarR family transcriptional regulator
MTFQKLWFGILSGMLSYGPARDARKWPKAIDPRRPATYALAMSPQRPIDFWLKLVDNLINEQFQIILEEHGVTRREWEILRLLSVRPARESELDDVLQPFFSSSEERPTEQLAELVESGWVARTGEEVRLTELGRTSYGRLSAVMARHSESFGAGISPTDVDTTLGVLERMARNLGWQDDVAT